MTTRIALRIAAALATALLVPAAQAQLFRAYLASDGSDANPCTLPAPCRLLPAALNAVADGGEIWMLDSANYNTGPVNVTKSVTILAIPGAVGSVVALGGAAIVVATPGVSLTLRNLVIVPIPGGGTAVGTVGLSAVLVSFGVPKEVAVAAVLANQLVFNYLPAIPGWFATRDLVRRDYL